MEPPSRPKHITPDLPPLHQQERLSPTLRYSTAPNTTSPARGQKTGQWAISPSSGSSSWAGVRTGASWTAARRKRTPCEHEGATPYAPVWPGHATAAKRYPRSCPQSYTIPTTTTKSHICLIHNILGCVVIFVLLHCTIDPGGMTICKDCKNPTGSIQRHRCVPCLKKYNNEKTRRSKKKNQYHKTPSARYRVYKYGAVKRNLRFELTMDDFLSLWNKECYYCNDAIHGIGIDRIDNNVGYTADNVVSCCIRCNIMKRSMGRGEFIEQCSKVAATHNDNK